jgi:hypothetical protein
MVQKNTHPRSKSALLVGVGISLASSLGMALMFLSLDVPSIYVVAMVAASLGFPGLYVEASILGNPHGGGSPAGFLLLVLPVNVLVYTVLTYGCMTLYSRIATNR